MGPGRLDLTGLMGDTKADHELVVELALSAGPAVVWWFDFATGDLSWMPGLDDMLGMAGADEALVRARLAEMVAPLTVAARTAPVWQGFELEQPCENSAGEVRWIQFRARVCAHPDRRGLVGIAADMSSRHDQRQALNDLTDRYRLLVDLTPDAIVVHEAGQVVYANPAAVRFVRRRLAVRRPRPADRRLRPVRRGAGHAAPHRGPDRAGRDERADRGRAAAGWTAAPSTSSRCPCAPPGRAGPPSR